MAGVKDAKAKIYLHGTFRVELPDGSNLTPRSVKAQALLAMLAVAPSGTRSRAWLQSMLWSTRSTRQASGSLRQCLVQVRHAFGPVASLISASRQNISIDLDRIDKIEGSFGEFLEGISLREEAFENWLRDQRRTVAARTENSLSQLSAIQCQQPARPTILIVRNAPDTPMIDWFVQSVADNIAQQLRETFSVEIVLQGREATHNQAWLAEVSSRQLDSASAGLRMALSHPASNTQIWARSVTIDLKGAPPSDHPDVLLTGNLLVEAVGDALFGNKDTEQDPDRLCRTAIRSLFAMTPEAVSHADRMFAQAHSVRPRGLYLAWRAQAMTIAMAERYDIDQEAVREEADALCAEALDMEPGNSMVLATVANTYGHLFRNHDRSLVLAKRSVLLNPGNPMAWWALSSASVYTGNTRASLAHALHASRLAVTSPNKFWWDNQLFGSALMEGRLKDAQGLAEECHAQNPNFRPPLRYLVALYANLGRIEKSIEVAEKLQRLEPDFSVDRLLNDKSYPASLIHKSPGLKLAALAELS